eukprot:10428122-Ditylum_brightwellii.AAC.1
MSKVRRIKWMNTRTVLLPSASIRGDMDVHFQNRRIFTPTYPYINNTSCERTPNWPELTMGSTAKQQSRRISNRSTETTN